MRECTACGNAVESEVQPTTAWRVGDALIVLDPPEMLCLECADIQHTLLTGGHAGPLPDPDGEPAGVGESALAAA